MKKTDQIFSSEDQYFMNIALTLSERGLGQVAPNPAVGCVLVRDGYIIGRGWTGPGGRPHAETVALDYAGNAKGATAYVTLEPCAHHGQTPPCADALVKAGVSKVIVATVDPDARVSGAGNKILEKAGIEVQVGLLKEKADFVNQGFFSRIEKNRPLVTVKIACSNDGKISAKKGKKTWITGAEARRRGHLYRANHDAIMIGIGTALVDNPTLDCRITGLEERSPIRVLIDTDLKLEENSKLCETARSRPLWIMTASRDENKKGSLEQKGVEIFNVKRDPDGGLDLAEVMNLLSEKGITRVLSEGGGKLNASLIRASLVDRLILFKSDDSIGENGVDALYDMPINELGHYSDLSLIDEGSAGRDCWQEYKVTAR